MLPRRRLVRSATTMYDYISPAGGDSRSAGAVAKVALVAQVQGRDATTFHDVDLIANLSSLKSTTAPNVGRFRDNVGRLGLTDHFSQSLALLALDHWGSVPADAVQWLVGLQCANGGYPFSPDEATGHCASNADADNDATAMAIQALVASGVSGQPGVAAALEKPPTSLRGFKHPMVPLMRLHGRAQTPVRPDLLASRCVWRRPHRCCRSGSRLALLGFRWTAPMQQPESGQPPVGPLPTTLLG